MSGKLIAQIYFYLISAASIALMVIGIFSIVTFIINSTQYDKYPLNYYAEECENDPYRFGKPAIDGATPATISAQERQILKDSCLKRVESERKN